LKVWTKLIVIAFTGKKSRQRFDRSTDGVLKWWLREKENIEQIWLNLCFITKVLTTDKDKFTFLHIKETIDTHKT
jgi:hypothetical protein